MRALLLPLLLLAPLVTGCLSDDEAPAVTAPAAKSAADAGATAGPQPSAPKDAYVVAPDPERADETVVAYPAAIQTNAAKPPVELDLSGVFEPGDCRGLSFGDLEDALREASDHRRGHDISENLAVGDVFQYEILFSYTNKDASWGEIHPFYAIGSTITGHSESTAQQREPIVVNWTGQGYRASDDDMAWIEVRCHYGAITEPIAYALTVKLTFADSAVPSQAPVLVPVPEGATRMFVRGVALDPSRGVASHFRVFGPDDQLVCECGLSSAAEVATVPLADAGDHVLLVDHTDNGFVSVAFDAPPTRGLEAMQVEWVRNALLESAGGPVDQTVQVDLPRVPLFMAAGVLGPGDGTPGLGKKTSVGVTNGRGEVLRQAWGGHTAMRTGEGDGGMWLGFWPGDWDFFVDHHAFAPGAHVVTVKAEQLRGEVVLYTRQYVR